MSMNLHCKEIELIQTPTYITYLCLYADLDKRKKSSWKTIMQKYLLWIREEFGNKLQRWSFVEIQQNSFKEVVKKYNKLHFYEE